jgi:hypothetical protein
MIKSRSIRWVGHVARNAKMRNVYNIFIGKPEGRDYLEDLGID